MGVELGELFEKKEIEFSDLKAKVIAIDAYNAIYQFLSIIRQRDGTPLTDSHGEITSHLSGILYRTTNLFEAGIKPVFVFDGEPPEFKDTILEERKKIREEAKILWEKAKSEGSPDAFKYAQASSSIDEHMVEDAKTLLRYMGIPIVQAPSEGEAQAAFMVKNNDAYAVGSQDYDALLFGSLRVIRNLAVSGKRKLPKRKEYVEVKPELIELEKGLLNLGISKEQLVDIALLIGTDYNEGIKGIGPKKALKLIKKYGDIEKVLDKLNTNIKNLNEIKEFFLNPPITTKYELKWRKPDASAIKEFLCIQHDFSESRVSKVIERLKECDYGQQTLDRFF